MTRAVAEQEATSSFAAIPVRYLMHSGQVVSENQGVAVTGDWPSRWVIKSFHDIGVLCSFIFEQARNAGAQKEVVVFRNAIKPAWPATEQLLVYIAALEFGKAKLGAVSGLASPGPTD